MDFKVQIVGIEQLVAAFKKASDVVMPILQLSVSQSIDVLAEYTVKGTVPVRSGFLLQSFGPTLQGLVGKWGPSMLYPVVYANAVEFGMPPSQGRYVPAIGKRLINNIHGDAWFGNWPGFPGRKYMEAILEDSQPGIDEIFGAALQKIVQGISS